MPYWERERYVPEAVIEKYHKSFQTPYLEEDFDEIRIVYTDNEAIILPDYSDLDQESKFHSKTLGDHMHAVASYVKENYSEEKYFKELYLVAKLHYIGKPYTQFFDGETHIITAMSLSVLIILYSPRQMN